MLRVWLARSASVIRRQQQDDDLAQELASNLVLLEDEYQRQGMTADDARRAARRATGGIEQAKELHRDARSFVWPREVWVDVKQTLRTLHRNPGFTAVAIATLGLGIAVNGAVFTITNAVVFKGYRLVEGNDRLVYLHSLKNGEYAGMSYPDFLDWRDQARSFVGMEAVASDGRITVNDRHGYAETHIASRVSAGTFRLLGQHPILGRDLASSDEASGAPPVAILSYRFWERRFDKDPAIISQVLEIDTVPTAVIGVMPEGFSFPENQALWLSVTPRADLERRDARVGVLWFVIGRLAEGVTIGQARAEMRTIGRRLEAAYPQTNQGYVPVLRRFTEFQVGANARTIYTVLWIAVGAVLLIACANLANLLGAHTLHRAPELATRLALGSGRWRIMRQLLIESLVLSGLGGLCGWVVAQWAVHTYARAANPPVDQWNHNLLDYAMDGRVLVYFIGISIGASILCGWFPALRISQWRLHDVVKDGGRTPTERRGGRLSWTLVTVQVTLTVVLLGAAGVMARSFGTLATAELGVPMHQTATMRLQLRDADYPDREALITFFERLTRQLEAIPGVQSVSVAGTLPGGGFSSGARRRPYEIVGADHGSAQNRPTTAVVPIGPAYFRTVDADLLYGREFSTADAEPEATTAIVNQRFAAMHWPGQDPIGRHVRLFNTGAPGPWLTIVGVAPNIRQVSYARESDRLEAALRHEMPPVVYIPDGPALRVVYVLMKTGVPLETLGPAVQREMGALDPNVLWMERLQRLRDRIAADPWYKDIRNHAVLFLSFAGVALVLTAVGLAGVLAHSVSRRTREIGIRMATGASPRQVLGVVIRQGLLPVAIGLCMGLGMSLGVNRVLTSELVQVSPWDPVALLVAAIALAAATALGCWIPARRATKLSPVIALRWE